MNLLYGSIGTVLVVIIGFLVAQWLPLKWSRVKESPVVYVVYGTIYLMLTALICYFLTGLSVRFDSYVIAETMWIYVIALSTSAVLYLVLNQWIFREHPRRTWLATQMAHNKLDRLFISALNEARLVCLVLETSRVYVGWGTEVPLPNDDNEYVNIVPIQSGHKNADHQFVFNVFYYKILDPHGQQAA